MSKYNLFIEEADKIVPVKVDKTHTELPSGAYTARWDYDFEKVIFEKISMNFDKIVDIPSPEYDYVVNKMKVFLKPESKSKFDKEGYLYKQSVLLHGLPGTGKSCIVQRVCQEAVKNQSIVLFNPRPEELPFIYKSLDDTNKDKLTLVIFEEIDELIKQGRERHLLNVLDGEVQKNNVIYLATTNYVETLPSRLLRPGRFTSKVEVKFPNLQARMYYLKIKGIEERVIGEWAKATDGFSIDELKETVQAVKLFDESLSFVVDRIRKLKGDLKEADEQQDEIAELETSIMKSLASFGKPLMAAKFPKKR